MKKVLIVEDDPMVALINRKYLEQIEDMKVIGPVMYQEDVWKMVNEEKPDLIIMDVFLPKENGIEILKSLRDNKCLIDVIMITAENSVDELKKAFACGIVDYLVKPFEFKRFEEAFKKYKIKNDLLCGNNELNQQDIDSIISIKISKDVTAEGDLPKGLNKRTLERIIDFLENNNSKVWTLRELADGINISNVTIKKYMDYLEKVEKVSVEVTCGNVGRPEFKYSLKY